MDDIAAFSLVQKGGYFLSLHSWSIIESSRLTIGTLSTLYAVSWRLTMLVQFNQKENSSPFDSIKRFNFNGDEFWTARDLMSLLGYRDYKRMEDAIQRAVASCQNTGNPCTEHFRAVSAKTNKAGRPLEDYHLTRFACYLTAMNGDSRKPEVASAQSYFAIKTREAEVVIPRQNEQLEILKMQNENLRLEKEASQSHLALLQFRHTITTTMPEVLQQKVLGCQVIEKIEYRDRIIKEDELLNDGSTITKTALCNRYGIMTRNGKPDFKKLNDTLSRANLPESAFDDTTIIRTNKELKREFLSELDRIVLVEQSRQMYLGE